MELISKELFSELDWYSIVIYLKEPPKIELESKVLKIKYYETLLQIVKPLIEEKKDWIKCFYYTHYCGGETRYHINLRIGTKNKTIENIRKDLNKFFKERSPDNLKFLEEETHKVEVLEIEGDKKRYAEIGERKYNEDAYYWFVMHWQTGGIYFLEILENGYDKFPELAAIPHLQWNLMGSIVPNPKDENSVIPESHVEMNRSATKGTLYLAPFGKEFTIDKLLQTG